MRRITLNRNGQRSANGRETSDLKAGQFRVGERVMLAIKGDCCSSRVYDEYEVTGVEPCYRFGGGRETVTFARVQKRRAKGGL